MSDTNKNSCPLCGQLHSAGAWRSAEILVPGVDDRGRPGSIKTTWGKKTRCGVAAIIDENIVADEVFAQASTTKKAT